MTKHKGYKIAVSLATVLQASLSAVVPAGLCILGAKYLIDKHNFPSGTMIVAILLGVSGGFYSMIKYVKSAMEAANRKDD